MKLRVLIPILAGAALALPHQARAVCPAGGNATTAARIGCIVTDGFSERHVATSITNARDKALRIGRSSTFLPVTQATYQALYSQVTVQRSERLRLAAWSCTYTAPAAGAGTATCNAVTGYYYLCARPANQFHQIYHLDSNPNGRCN
jgi:hypothetical protein